MSQKKIDLGWGNPYFLLEILQQQYTPTLYPTQVSELSYPPKDGLPELQELTKKVIEKTTGFKFKYILITNGATSAINTILRYEKPIIVHTGQYGYPLYENIIKDNGFIRVRHMNNSDSMSNIRLIDSPSNPEGNQFIEGNSKTDLWDAVYHNQVYTDNVNKKPKKFKYYVGSYSKLLGVAGCRVGFIAMNNKILRDELFMQNWKDLAGVSTLSQRLIIDILGKIDLDLFMKTGNTRLCYAREELHKISHIFDGQDVNEVGMFYCVKTTPKVKKFLDSCDILYTVLDEETIRLSMGNTLDKTKAAVKKIINKDRIK